MVTLFDSYSYDGVSAGIWVIHTEVANLGARWSRFLTVTLMMVWVLVNGSYIHRWQIRVQDGHAWINSSPSLPNHCLWYGKLWVPSQRVVTLFNWSFHKFTSKASQDGQYAIHGSGSMLGYPRGWWAQSGRGRSALCSSYGHRQTLGIQDFFTKSSNHFQSPGNCIQFTL